MLVYSKTNSKHPDTAAWSGVLLVLDMLIDCTPLLSSRANMLQSAAKTVIAYLQRQWSTTGSSDACQDTAAD